MPRGTRLRSIRVADEIWLPAQKVAAERGDNLSEVIRAALERYTQRHAK